MARGGGSARRAVAATGAALLLAAGAAAAAGRAAAGGSSGCGLSGEFRPHYGSLHYDSGGTSVMPAGTRTLVLSGTRWQYGTSSGSWRTEPVAAADWGRWQGQPYGPTRKIVLTGWAGGTADGPIDERGAVVDGFWVVYRTRPPAAPGLALLRFIRAAANGCQGAAAATTAPVAAAGAAQVAVSPARLGAGGTVAVTARGFAPGERLILTEEYTSNGSARIADLTGGDADGRGTLAFTRPTYSFTTPGTHVLCAEGSDSGRKACGSYLVVAAGATTTAAQAATTRPATTRPSGSGAAATTSAGGPAAPKSDGGWTSPKSGGGWTPPKSG